RGPRSTARSIRSRCWPRVATRRTWSSPDRAASRATSSRRPRAIPKRWRRGACDVRASATSWSSAARAPTARRCPPSTTTPTRRRPRSCWSQTARSGCCAGARRPSRSGPTRCEPVSGARSPIDEGSLAGHWPLDPKVVFLNHGSFGACPSAVLEHQSQLRAEMEAEPVRFLSRELDDRLDVARAALARFLGADADDLAFVTNATSGVNAVLRSRAWSSGDELLTTDHVYRACRNAMDYVAAHGGARVVVAPLPFPLASPDEVVDAVLARVTPLTRLALLDHVTSPTGLVLPIERLIAELSRRNVEVLVDGAHAPGMLPLDL